MDRVIFFCVKGVRSEVMGHFDLSFFLIRDTLTKHLDAGEGGPLLSLFLSAHLEPFLGSWTRKQNLSLVMGALKNLGQFNQYSFLIYFPPYFVMIFSTFFDFSSKPRCLNIGCSGS